MEATSKGRINAESASLHRRKVTSRHGNLLAVSCLTGHLIMHVQCSCHADLKGRARGCSGCAGFYHFNLFKKYEYHFRLQLKQNLVDFHVYVVRYSRTLSFSQVIWRRCHFVYHKSHVEKLRIEPRPSGQDADI